MAVIRTLIRGLERIEREIGGGTRVEPLKLDTSMRGIAVMDEESPIPTTAGAVDRRTEAALSLCDPETFGYLLILLRKDPKKKVEGEILVRGFVKDEWYPAFRETCDRIKALASEQTVR